MHTESSLVAIVVIAIGLAFLLATLAHRLKTSMLVGYLLAGVVAGPYTPGFVADQSLANQLAEIGVILLMFGVGLHFSLKDLLAGEGIAVPRGRIRIALINPFGIGFGGLLRSGPG